MDRNRGSAKIIENTQKRCIIVNVKLAQKSNWKPILITKRAVLIGALLIVANSYWLAYGEMLWHTAHLTQLIPQSMPSA